MYNQIIDPTQWTTMSEMTLGEAYKLVQNTIANLVLSIWSNDNPFTLLPEGVSAEDKMDLARRTREWVIYNLRDRMNIDQKGFRTILDGVKLGSGYGIIEPAVIFPMDRVTAEASEEGESAAISTLELAEPKIITQYRHCSFGSVLPIGDGVTPDESSAVTLVDLVPEFAFRAMYSTPENELDGNVEAMIDYVKRNGQMNASTSNIRTVIATLAGKNAPMPRRVDLKGVTMIPIVKQFRKDQHTWIVADKFKIYKSEKTVQTLQCPLIKYSFSPEGDNWFNRGVINPNADLMRTTEIFYNAMIDLFSLHLHPHQVFNIDAQHEEEDVGDMQPYGITYVRGQPSQAQAFITPPPLPLHIAGIGDKLQSMGNDNAALNITQGGQVSPGIVRGGGQALETLLQLSTNREKVLAKHLEHTYYAPIIKITLIYSSLYATDDEEFVILKTAEGAEDANGRKAGDKYHEVVKITKDDLAHVWRVAIDFKDKRRNAISESAHRLAVYDRLVQDPEVNTRELKHYVIGEETQAKKMLIGVDKAARLADMQQLAAIQGGGQEGQLQPNAAGGLLGGGGVPTPGGEGGQLGAQI